MTMRLASKVREKADLPAGYQFGDAALWRYTFSDGVVVAGNGRGGQGHTITVKIPERWRAPHMNAAAVLEMRAAAAGDRLNALPMPKRSAEDLALIAEVNGDEGPVT